MSVVLKNHLHVKNIWSDFSKTLYLIRYETGQMWLVAPGTIGMINHHKNIIITIELCLLLDYNDAVVLLLLFIMSKLAVAGRLYPDTCEVDEVDCCCWRGVFWPKRFCCCSGGGPILIWTVLFCFFSFFAARFAFSLASLASKMSSSSSLFLFLLSCSNIWRVEIILLLLVVV